MSFSQLIRMIWIDGRITGGRALNRADLMSAFGISVPQAAADIRRFSDLHPGRLEYDRRKRRYCAAPGTAPIYPASLRMQVTETVRSVNMNLEKGKA